MKNNLSLAAAFLFLAAGASLAQTPPSTGIAYQQAGAIGTFTAAVPAPAGQAVFAMPSSVTTMIGNPGAMTGSPFSATRESHSLQVLGDGTRIDHSESSHFYRDSQGRTRTENGPAPNGSVMIQDPVAGVTLILNPALKTAEKIQVMKLPAQLPAPASSGLTEAGTRTTARFEMHNSAGVVTTMAQAASGPVAGAAIAVKGGVIAGSSLASAPMFSFSSDGAPPQITDLGTQLINGVQAEGKRTTLTIPAGQIGNDRPINVVGETWYSGDLQMIVKSSNSDPRFGDTTFELTNVSRAEPDPLLFQIPSDYAVSDPKVNMIYKTMQSRE